MTSKSRGIRGALPMLWRRWVSGGGFTLRLRAREFASVAPLARYRVCYSVNGGVGFHPAGEAPPFLQLTILPPTVVGLSAKREGQMYNLNSVTATALRLERLFDRDASLASDLGSFSPQVSRFAGRPPSYYHHASVCFVGSGRGLYVAAST
ncbi:hypothetical protein TraAM80_08699 [Trypanosoma rangeli]|uniref:Uncharacterized protein n=1 Tax=Trypanosoma rangeli TaxID=5698 RepID=A0A422MZA7_TRYRA|nr:uncharacterized protein TraAM80_08699 [Trypanosoma rangeli]RNE98552.1 hypothetical protein TraAM80_08699 [Trypanosoma rangeli]|eukprot:RNE98552.1 hypothetical protein TraAM80_08699 [Trypanosoma rangeli]